MDIQLTKGTFSPHEAVELVSKLIQAKITFHEQKISKSDMEEDIEYRERRIRDLQTGLADLRNRIASLDQDVAVETMVSVKL